MKTTTKDWLNYAKTDLLNCELIINEEFLTNIVAFHPQQVVEKSFKALIEEKGLNIPRVHNLQRLFGVIQSFIHEEIDMPKLVLLDSIYTSSRYPGDIGLMASGKPSLTESKELFDSAKQIFEIIVQSIE